MTPWALAFSALAAATASNPYPTDAVEDQVDLMEVNHFYDDHGKHRFDQIIFYEWSGTKSRYRVKAWRMLNSASQLPRRDYQHEVYSTVWRDGELLRKVTAPVIRETWTQYDPEVADREHWPKERRTELARPRSFARQSTAIASRQ